MSMNNNDSEILCHWSARRIQPRTLFYVIGVFAVFIMLSYFVFHSMPAVKALALTAFGAIVSIIPGVVGRVEYRLTDQGLERRPINQKRPGGYKNVFNLSQLSHIVQKRHGLKYYLNLEESNPLKRFWKSYFSDAFSGEVHIEKTDRERVIEALRQRRISCR